MRFSRASCVRRYSPPSLCAIMLPPLLSSLCVHFCISPAVLVSYLRVFAYIPSFVSSWVPLYLPYGFFSHSLPCAFFVSFAVCSIFLYLTHPFLTFPTRVLVHSCSPPTPLHSYICGAITTWLKRFTHQWVKS